MTGGLLRADWHCRQAGDRQRAAQIEAKAEGVRSTNGTSRWTDMRARARMSAWAKFAR